MGTNVRDVVVKTGEVLEGRYRIIKTLGAGEMGTVFLAEHVLIKRQVAVKILHAELAADAELIERFMSDARGAGTLGHPNIVESTDMGFTGDHVPYVVFEYLEGTLLTDEVYRVGGLPVRRVVRIAQQIAAALYAAHQAGIVHRDLESDHVFLTDKDDVLDHVKVLDFGVSHLTKGGTPEFLAPEQITMASSVDKRADIYALGVIMYEMLTARRPFSNDEDPRSLMRRIVNNPPPPLQRNEVPQALGDMIFDKLLAKDPADRYQSMQEVEAALAQFAATDSSRARTSQGSDPPAEKPDVARNSDLIPRPARMIDTPWPPAQIVETVALPPTPATKPWLLYGIAAAGVLFGGLGLAVGLRGSRTAHDTTAQTTPAQPLPAAATPAPRETQAPRKIQVDLEVNVPNARVTFRRRVASAPAAMQIAASDIVELVEVSAPGYKTMRYWLTFDRPTHLTAKLVKGAGFEEASEEATLIALGEIAPPASLAVAAAAPASEAPKAMTVAAKAVEAAPVKIVEPAKVAAAMPTEPAPAPVPAPRKIGRGAAEEPAAVAALAEPTWEPEKPAPVAEPVKAEPVVVKPEPAPEPLPPPVVAKPEPAAEPAIAKPAIDRATVSSVIGQHRPQVLKCIAEGKKKSPEMKGTLTLQLNVDAEGRVRAQVQSTLGNPLVAACVIKAANAWMFPSRSGGDLATVAYPFTIN